MTMSEKIYKNSVVSKAEKQYVMGKQCAGLLVTHQPESIPGPTIHTGTRA